MNFSFAGLHGTGKSTIAKKVAEQLNFTFYSTGMAFRELAKEKGMTLEEFSHFAEDHFEIDKELDGKILALARTEQNYMFEGQLPTYMLKDLKDFAILLICDEKVRIERMMDRDERTFEEQRHETLVREESERQRFIDIYSIDVLDPGLMHQTFDLIINTTNLGIDAVFKICITALTEFIRERR